MLDPIIIIKTAGILGIFLVIFIETGFFFGFFLPGDTLLFSAGIFALQGFFPLWAVVLAVALASILGNSLGYLTGRKIGRKLFEREASFFFNKKRIYEAENFYKRYGSFTIILARFIPVIRTFAPLVAGIGGMKKKTFIICNLIGGIVWATVVPLLGYLFGSLIPNPDRYVLPVLLLAVGASLLPFIFSAMRYYFFSQKK